MRPDDARLLAAAAAFAAADVFGSAVAMREDVRGEPLGITVPLAVPSGLIVGWGAGVAAPWPMPVAGLVVACRAGRVDGGTAPGLLAAGLGIGCIAGTLIEPVTYHRRTWGTAIRTAIAFNLLASAALAAAGLRHAAGRRQVPG